MLNFNCFPRFSQVVVTVMFVAMVMLWFFRSPTFITGWADLEIFEPGYYIHYLSIYIGLGAHTHAHIQTHISTLHRNLETQTHRQTNIEGGRRKSERERERERLPIPVM